MCISLEASEKKQEAARLIMTWRNDPVTLSASFHSRPKVWPDFWEEYRGTYFELADLPPLFGLHAGRRVAFLRFRPYSDPALDGVAVDISINIEPDSRGQGLGPRFIRAATERALETGVDAVVAEIKKNNPSSVRVFEKSGFAYWDEIDKTVEDTGEVVPIFRYIHVAHQRTLEELFLAGASRAATGLGDVVARITGRDATPDVETSEIVFRGNVTLRWTETPPEQKPDEAQDAAVDEIWRAACARTPGLFNGTYMNVAAHRVRGDQIEVTGSFFEYKYFVAHLERPQLALPVRAIGVSGITLVREGERAFALLAERSPDVSSHPGRLELVPSGAVDRSRALEDGRVDYLEALLTELEEECGLSRKHVKDVRTFALTFDVLEQVYDVCCCLELGIRRDSLPDMLNCSDEYRNPRLVAVDELASFLQGHTGGVMPSTLALVEAYGAGTWDEEARP